jgi:hypothetical protein
MMSANDSRKRIGSGGRRGRLDGPPGWVDQVFTGSSHAEKEADQDLMLRVGLLLLGAVALLLTGLDAVFTTLGLQFGWWSAPVFVPVSAILASRLTIHGSKGSTTTAAAGNGTGALPTNPWWRASARSTHNPPATHAPKLVSRSSSAIMAPRTARCT